MASSHSVYTFSLSNFLVSDTSVGTWTPNLYFCAFRNIDLNCLQYPGSFLLDLVKPTNEKWIVVVSIGDRVISNFNQIRFLYQAEWEGLSLMVHPYHLNVPSLGRNDHHLHCINPGKYL